MSDDLKNHLIEMRDGLEEDLKNMAEEMESLDPASVEFDELDTEYNFINGQMVAFNYVLAMMGAYNV
jgi:hypothetical protein